MYRLTGRSKKGKGTLAIKDLQTAYDKLADYEDTGLEPYEIRDIKIVYDRVKDADDCNNCRKAAKCKYKPRPGHLVRINCPLWEGELSEEERMQLVAAWQRKVMEDEKD